MTTGSVLHLVTHGSRNPLLSALVQGLAAEGIKSAVAALDAQEQLGADLSASDVPFRCLRASTSVAGIASSAWRLRSLANEWRPAFILAHGFLPSVTMTAAFALGPRPRTLVVRHHNIEHHLRGSALHRWLDGWSVKRADHVIAVSDAVRRTVIGEGARPDAVSVIYHSVDLLSLDPTEEAVAAWRESLGAGPTAVAVGRIDAIKAHEDVVRAVAEVRQGGIPVTLAVAGTGPADRQEALLAVANDLGMRDAITLLGWVDDVPALVRSADIFVSASRDESFGQAVLEALAVGTPTAVTTVGGVAEVVGASQAPIAAGDVSGLATRIREVLADPALARREAMEAKEDVRQRFGTQDMSRTYAALLGQLEGRR